MNNITKFRYNGKMFKRQIIEIFSRHILLLNMWSWSFDHGFIPKGLPLKRVTTTKTFSCMFFDPRHIIFYSCIKSWWKMLSWLDNNNETWTIEACTVTDTRSSFPRAGTDNSNLQKPFYLWIVFGFSPRILTSHR